jgi:primosomal protein N' (replication factor Y)
MSSAYYIQVILPLALRGAFTYRVQEELIPDIMVGKRVVVPFGKRRFYAALVYKLDVVLPKGAKPKDVAYVVDDQPVVTEEQLAFWEWIAQYYASGLGAVMNAALPNALKLSSQTTICLNPAFDDYPEMTEDERMVLANLPEKEGIGIKELERLGSKRSMQRAVNGLLKKGVILLSEEMGTEIKPKLVKHIVLNHQYANDASLNELLSQLERAPKQMEAVMRYLGEQSVDDFERPIPRDRFLRRFAVSPAALNALVDKGVFQWQERYPGMDEEQGFNSFELNDNQQEVFLELKQKFAHNRTALLHGVTGSGKTLIYAELIRENAARGQQTLYLVPEIALTTQLVTRLKALLGDEILVYHSRFSNKERLTTWLRLLESGGSEIIVGPRSAMFLPMNNLGLIIVDEEHESSFKQHESEPHYHARDAAVWLAHHRGAHVLLGSATPSVESYYNARQGKYSFASLQQRHDGAQMPLIRVVDMTKQKRADNAGSSFSGELVEAIKATLIKGKQVILFQNRRGYAPYMLCEACGWSAECVNCDVNLTYHKYFDKMLCHYCGYGIKKPTNCPNCASAKIKIKGFGTEKLEGELEQLFPKARIGRMDLDTTRKRNAFQNLIDAFDDQVIDILVGTQMVAKGLDFENVGLVGVMNADALWNRPDFRAFERAYQLLTQVAGRAGRKKGKGEVLIQTFRPEHPVIDLVVNRSYEDMYRHQFAERQSFSYPPFVRMIKFQLMHPDPNKTKEAAIAFGKELRQRFKSGVLGPEEPSIPRVRGRFIRQIFLKVSTKSSISDVRRMIWSCVDMHEGHETHRAVKLKIDVDPY